MSLPNNSTLSKTMSLCGWQKVSPKAKRPNMNNINFVFWQDFFSHRTKVRWIQFTAKTKFVQWVEYLSNSGFQENILPTATWQTNFWVSYRPQQSSKCQVLSHHWLVPFEQYFWEQGRGVSKATSDPFNGFTILMVQQQCNIIRVTIGGQLFQGLIIWLTSKITAYSEHCP